MRGTQRLYFERERTATFSLWQLYPLFFCAVYLSHLTLLRLPYFWDEAGYYIPAAWDCFRTGTLIPVTTLTNAHPPLPSMLLAGWWHVAGFTPMATRTLVCMVSAAALLGVYRIGRGLLGTTAAVATTLLTAAYPIWFAQSTLAHADIFAAAFTLWGLSFYLDSAANGLHPTHPEETEMYGAPRMILAAVLFSFAALAKETAILMPMTLAGWEALLYLRTRDADHARWLVALGAPVLPLSGWYAYHYRRTGFIFGNPKFLQYNATGNLDPYRVGMSLYHRLLHLTMHMNLFVPVLCTVAILFMPAIPGRRVLGRASVNAIAVVLFAGWLAFSILGGALLTRYLLPLYPLVLLVCVGEWQRRLSASRFAVLGGLSVAAFLAGIWIDPPYAFAPEDNLTYRDMIVLHQRAITLIEKSSPQATVLTAWPATAELTRPELGYTKSPIKVMALEDFTLAEIQKAAADPGAYDTALLFSTKWAPPPGHLDLTWRGNSGSSNRDNRYFDFHEDIPPAEAAAILHGAVTYQAHIRGEWVAVLRFPRVVDAGLRR